MLRRIGLMTLLASLLAMPALASDIKVANGWVSQPIYDESPPAYFLIRNRGSETRTIVSATSPKCESITIRRVVFKDGQMTSEALKEMQIPAGGDVDFIPRGLFLRLESPEKLDVDEIVPIVLEFADGEKVSFEATVKDE